MTFRTRLASRVQQRRRRLPRTLAPRFCFPLAVLLAAVTASICCAQSGDTQRVQGAGLNIRVDLNWLDGGGYRPLRYSVTPLTTLKFDRRLVFQATLHHVWGGEEHVQVTQDVLIPAGTTTNDAIEFVLSLPTNCPWGSATIVVLENDEVLKSLLHSINSNWSYSEQFDEAFPRILFVRNTLPDTTAIAHILQAEQHYRSLGRPAPVPGKMPLPTAIAKPVTSLPERWIDYTCADIVVISVTALKDLEKKHPKKLAALRDWTRSGGALLVSSIGADFQGRNDLEDMLDLSDAVVADGKSGWFGPDDRMWNKSLQGIGVAVNEPTAPLWDGRELPQNQGYYEEDVYVDQSLAELGIPFAVESGEAPALPKKSPFLMHPCGLGMVAAWSGDPFDAEAVTWAWFFNTLKASRYLWTQRHGLSCHEENDQFYQFLVEGVGRAPVNAFRILITLFVLAIGPVNYYLLRRYGRLHLLIVTVPLSAAGVTLLLFGYAMIADGIGVRVRARSVTQIDQQSGRAECWARLSYYAGVAPGGGMTFPDDVAVLPISYAPFDDTGASRRLIWEPGQQHLRAGWLRSRTPLQLLTMRSRKTDARLDITPDENGAMKLTNHLGTRVEQVLICDDDCRIYSATDLADGDEANAEAVSDNADLEGFRVALSKNRPSYPPGMRADQIYFSRRGYFPPTSIRLPVDTATSCLNRRIDEWKRVLSSGKGFPPRSYIAIVENSPEVEYGVKRWSKEPSLHLVIGYW